MLSSVCESADTMQRREAIGADRIEMGLEEEQTVRQTQTAQWTGFRYPKGERLRCLL